MRLLLVAGVEDRVVDSVDDMAEEARGREAKSCFVRGSINVDEYFLVKTIVKPGETIGSHGYHQQPGGKGANSAVAIAKAGGKVDFAGTIGEDATWLRQAMQDFGVGVEHLRPLHDLPTGRAFIQVSDSGENSIVLLHGANHPPSFALPKLSSSRYSHALFQNEIPYQHTLEGVEAANEAGICTVWNPSPLPTPSDFKAHGHPKPDWLVVNEEEAHSYAQLRGSGSPDGGDHIATAGRFLARETVKAGVVITLGGDGARLFVRDSDRSGSQDQGETIQPGKVRGKVVDTTGAGDCFTGYFVAQLLKLGRDPPRAEVTEALAIACQAAAMSVEKEGTMSAVPTMQQVKQRMEESQARWPDWA